MTRQYVLFDIDGTLVSTGGAGRRALEVALAQAFDQPGGCDGITLNGRTDRSIVADLFRRWQIADTAAHWERFRAAYLSVLPGCLAHCAGRVLPGIQEALAHLGPRDEIAIGLLTGNIAAGAKLKLSHYGLWEAFSFGGFGDFHHERDSVAREALEACEQHAGERVDPRRVWVIGDTPLDVRCARAIGARAIAVATGGVSRETLAASEPDLLLDDFSAWGALVERLA